MNGQPQSLMPGITGFLRLPNGQVVGCGFVNPGQPQPQPLNRYPGPHKLIRVSRQSLDDGELMRSEIVKGQQRMACGLRRAQVTELIKG